MKLPLEESTPLKYRPACVRGTNRIAVALLLPLELRFTSRAVGDTSYTNLGFEHVVEVSNFHPVEHSNPIGNREGACSSAAYRIYPLRKAYISKVASKNTILHRISLVQANIDALERRNEFFRAMKEAATSELSMDQEELDCIRTILGSLTCGSLRWPPRFSLTMTLVKFHPSRIPILERVWRMILCIRASTIPDVPLSSILIKIILDS